MQSLKKRVLWSFQISWLIASPSWRFVSDIYDAFFLGIATTWSSTKLPLANFCPKCLSRRLAMSRRRNCSKTSWRCCGRQISQGSNNYTRTSSKYSAINWHKKMKLYQLQGKNCTNSSVENQNYENNTNYSTISKDKK